MALVFDLGMNDGQDTQHYLNRGLKVVAVEASSYLCGNARLKFKDAIARGDLHIVHRALSYKVGTVSFFVPENSQRGSVHPDWASDRYRYKIISEWVAGISISALIELYGRPNFIKCDIEGADYTLLQQLKEASWCPTYLSVEDCRFGFEYLKLMNSMGYTGFKLSDQSILPENTSGPLGDELPGEWFSYEGMLIYYNAKVRDRVTGKRIAPPEQWFDIHCTRYP